MLYGNNFEIKYHITSISKKFCNDEKQSKVDFQPQLQTYRDIVFSWYKKHQSQQLPSEATVLVMQQREQQKWQHKLNVSLTS